MLLLPLKLHHIGFIVDNIEKYERSILYHEKTIQLYDSVQNAILALYSTGGGTSIELIEPQNEQAFTYNFLKKKGNGFHHLCYELPNIEVMNVITTSKRMLKIAGPLPAILFGGRDVFFFYTKNKEIVEFLLEK